LSESGLPSVAPIPSQDEEEDEVSQFFGSSQDHGQNELVQEAWSWIDLPLDCDNL